MTKTLENVVELFQKQFSQQISYKFLTHKYISQKKFTHTNLDFTCIECSHNFFGFFFEKSFTYLSNTQIYISKIVFKPLKSELKKNIHSKTKSWRHI